MLDALARFPELAQPIPKIALGLLAPCLQVG
jgi:hypothetical protein